MKLFRVSSNSFVAGFITTDSGIAYKSSPKLESFVLNKGIDTIKSRCRSLGWSIEQVEHQDRHQPMQQ